MTAPARKEAATVIDGCGTFPTGKLTATVYGVCNAIADAVMILCGIPLKQRQAILLNSDAYRDARREIVDGAIKEVKKIFKKG